jgi:hypothetical protein
MFLEEGSGCRVHGKKKEPFPSLESSDPRMIEPMVLEIPNPKF